MMSLFRKIRNLCLLLKYINANTIVFNFRMLSYKQAFIFPFFVSKNVNLLNLSGEIEINSKIKIGMIRIGYGDAGIFDRKYSRTIMEIKGNLIFNGNAFIGHGSRISVGEKGILTFGENFRISAETSIIANKCITIGNNCLLSWQIDIYDTDFHEIINENGIRLNDDKPITVGDNVWISCKCLILKGSVIPSNVVISANSTVSKKLEGNNLIFGGEPLRVIKEKVTWR